MSDFAFPSGHVECLLKEIYSWTCTYLYTYVFIYIFRKYVEVFICKLIYALHTKINQLIGIVTPLSSE